MCVCVRLLSWDLGFFELCICVGLLTFLGFMVLQALGLFVRLLTFLAFRVLRALRLFVRLLTFLAFRVLRALSLFVRFLTIFFRFRVGRALRRLLILSSVCHSDSFVECGGVESGVLIRVVTTVDYKLKG